MKLSIFCKALFLKTISCILCDAFKEHYWGFLKQNTSNEKIELFQVIEFDFHLKRNSNYISVVFRESVRKNARDCFEKKGFAGNRHFQGTANFGYLEAIKCHFEARNGKFGQILSRIQSYFIFCPLHLAVKGPCRKSSLSRNSKFRVLRGN